MSLSTDHLRSQLGRVADTAIVPAELADRARQRARRGRARIVTFAALIVVVAAAGSAFAIRNLVRTGSLPAATYQMEFGLRTPTGTRQLGPVFVQNADLQTTVYEVNGDPYAVFRDLAAQLRRAGFASSAGSFLCGTKPTTRTPPWTCDAGAERRTSRDDMVSMSMTVSLGDGPYQAELVIRTASAPLVPNNPVPIYKDQMFEVPTGPAPVQPDRARRDSTVTENGPHDPTGDAGSFFRYSDDATPVVPPFRTATCGSLGGFTSLESVAGSPVAAAKDYVSQLAAHGLRVTGSNETWTRLKGGSDIADITVSRGRDGTGYLLFSYCGR